MQPIGVTGSPASHQTVKLMRGQHASPDDGVCVMELASMLADEPFSDHPQSVCPVIGAFLRAYNDRLDDARRQDLYAYAAKAVGTRGTLEVERRRVQMCREWVRRTRAPSNLPDEPIKPRRRPGRLRRWLQSYCHRPEYAGHQAAIAFGQRELVYGGRTLHRALLRFVDELIAVGRDDEPWLADPQNDLRREPAGLDVVARCDFDPQGG